MGVLAMTDEFQIGDGTLSVRDQSGAYQRIETPQGYTDYVFRNVVAAIDTHFRLYGSLPSVTDVQKVFPSATVKTISGLFVTAELERALEYRGVSWKSDSGLSMEQQLVLLKLTDPTDRRTTNVKLKELGVPMARYQAWLKHPLFAEHFKQRTEDLFSSAVPVALQKLLGNVEAGDQRAIEKVLEITGRYDPANKQIEDVRSLVTRLVEVVIKHVPEKERRAAIMSDMQAVSLSYELVSPRAIEE
jgi:hypothetical protein